MTVETVAAGRYRIERVLGHGGMASVYLARDVELDRPVAIKVLAEQLADDPSFRRRFVREAQLAARLSHVNVVRVYDAGVENDRPFIVMEFVPGATVASLLAERGKLLVDEAVEIAAQTARGLQAAHDAGLVHRDIKPQNVLVRDDGIVKIADFGIARATEASRLTQLGTVLGTAAYLAPEQAFGEDVGPAADVYSLGAVLYQMLAGRPPFEFASLAELAERQRNGVVTPLRDLEPSVSEDLEALVMRCLARDPRFRPASAGDVAAALEPDATAVELPARATRSVPGSGAWMWIAAAVVVATIALAVGLAQVGGPGVTTVRFAPRVQPIAPGATPAEEARNLAAWLRSHSR